jgi:histidine decarboxylase
MSFSSTPDSHITHRLDELYDRLVAESRRFVGYPCNANFDYSPLHRFLAFPINNVGDPFASSTFRVNTREFEREVLAFFAEIYDTPRDDWWGYVTSGGTEGNLYGLYLARELHPTGMVYYSEDTHYSVSKNLRVLGMRHIQIQRQRNGEIDYDDLRETVRIHRDVPPIVFANIGTTMTGAVDDVSKIRDILAGFAIDRYYIHGDAALSGMILPFVSNPQPFRFSDGLHSISVSGHKMIGAPVPCGIVLAIQRNVDRIARSIEYIGSLDTTILGSRNALSPLILWYAISMHGKEGFRDLVHGCFRTAEYAIARFRERGIEAWRNENSVTVVFPRPPANVLRKWQIAVDDDIAHIITMPHVTTRHIDEIVDDVDLARESS